MPRQTKSVRSPDVADDDVDAVMAATRAFVAMAAKSLALVEDVVTLIQWRALVVISGAERLSLNEVADQVGVHPSTATRFCDRLIGDGLLLRQQDPADRRYVVLSLTPKGQRLVAKVTAARRSDIQRVLGNIEPSRRRPIASALEEFAGAVGQTNSDVLWDLPAEATATR